MAFFSKRSQGPAPSRTRTQDCIYKGESFPIQGEKILISGIEGEVLFNQSDIPKTWTEIVRAIQARTGEPDTKAVQINILGTLLAMICNKVNKLGPALGLEEPASRAASDLKSGVDDVTSCRRYFSAHTSGRDAFDFELIKSVSLLTSPQSVNARREGGWVYPNIWGGDLSGF